MVTGVGGGVYCGSVVVVTVVFGDDDEDDHDEVDSGG